MSANLKALVRRLLDDAEYRKDFIASPNGATSMSTSSAEYRALMRMRARFAMEGEPKAETAGPTSSWP